MRNRQIVLRSRPSATPTPDNFELVEQAVPDLEDGQLLIRHEYLGLAPAARIRMSEARSYAPPLPLGSPIYGQAVGVVLKSRNTAFAEGDAVVISDGGWQEYSVSDGTSVNRIDTGLAPATVWLGTLGVSGFTAYVGMQDFLGPRTGETIVVSAASGAVGSVAVQMARIAGCRAVGIAGSAEKCAYVTQQLGAHACADHRASDFADALAAACPTGIDGYFENVGGAVRDTLWPLMNDFGRVAICGLISQYSDAQAPGGPDWFPILTKRLSVRGFMLRDHPDRYEAFVADMAQWVSTGQVKYREHIAHGLEDTPRAFIDMLSGRNFGKTLVRLNH
ncbi:MAG: NADP-dependent oxidoreductase [Sphingobium sp.]